MGGCVQTVVLNGIVSNFLNFSAAIFVPGTFIRMRELAVPLANDDVILSLLI